MSDWTNSTPWIWVGETELVSLPTLPHLHHQGKISGAAPASSPNAAASKQSWFSCSHASGSRSPQPLTPQSALLCCPGEVRGSLSQEWHPAWDRASSEQPLNIHKVPDTSEWSLVIIRATDMNTDPRCCIATDHGSQWQHGL